MTSIAQISENEQREITGTLKKFFADYKVSLEAVCEQMGRTPPWTPGLILRADGDEMPYYMKT